MRAVVRGNAQHFVARGDHATCATRPYSVTLSGLGVGPTKVLREKVHCRSLRSIHIDYNQPLVGGPSVHPTPATQIANIIFIQLPGGVVYNIYQ